MVGPRTLTYYPGVARATIYQRSYRGKGKQTHYHFVVCLWTCERPLLFLHLFPLSLFIALNMASILQKLITPLFSGTPEPARNKVTVVGVGQVGMACAVSILLRVRPDLLCLYSCQITTP